MKKRTLDSEEFYNRGIMPLRGFLPQNLIKAARESIFAELTRLKIRVNGKISNAKIQHLPIFQQTGRLAQMVKISDEISRLFSAELLIVMNTLAGSPLQATGPKPQILLSLPHKEQWSLTNLNWHLDLDPPQVDEIPGIQAFILMDDVRPKGGATLALAGSHKLHYIDSKHNVHGVLKVHTDFNSAPEKFCQAQKIDQTEIQIIEMCGQAGDVYLMDLRILHTPSVNSKPNIRMMATNRFLKMRK